MPLLYPKVLQLARACFRDPSSPDRPQPNNWLRSIEENSGCNPCPRSITRLPPPPYCCLLATLIPPYLSRRGRGDAARSTGLACVPSKLTSIDINEHTCEILVLGAKSYEQRAVEKTQSTRSVISHTSEQKATTVGQKETLFMRSLNSRSMPSNLRTERFTVHLGSKPCSRNWPRGNPRVFR